MIHPGQPISFVVSLSIVARHPAETAVMEVRMLTQLRLKLSPKRARRKVIRRPELVAYWLIAAVPKPPTIAATEATVA